MKDITPQEIRTVLNNINEKIRKLNKMKVHLQEAYLLSYQDLNAYPEIEMIIDSLKVDVMNL